MTIIYNGETKLIAMTQLVKHAEKLLQQKEDLSKIYSTRAGKYTLLDIFLRINSPKFEELITHLIDKGAKGYNLHALINRQPTFLSQEKLYNAYLESIVDSKAGHEILHNAALNLTQKNLEPFNALVKKGYPINALNSEGKTAAQVALETKNYSFLLWLIKAGADLSICDKQGQSISKLIQQEIMEQRPLKKEWFTSSVSKTPVMTVEVELFEQQLRELYNKLPWRN